MRALQGALARAGLRCRTRLAMKAQREPEVLALVRRLGGSGSPESVGLDVCSPGEAAARARPRMVARGDQLHGHQRVGARPRRHSRAPGPPERRPHQPARPRRPARARPGHRDPRQPPGRRAPGAARTSSLYSGARPTKFGIYAEQLDEALALARATRSHHRHRPLPRRRRLPRRRPTGFRRGRRPRRRDGATTSSTPAAPSTEVNTGGGLGVPRFLGERPLDLDAYAGILAAHLGSARRRRRGRAG